MIERFDRSFDTGGAPREIVPFPVFTGDRSPYRIPRSKLVIVSPTTRKEPP